MSMRRIVQFPHPGNEHGADRWLNASEGWKDWNCDPEHKRKFLLAQGSWTRNTNVHPNTGTLTFWGEWEPQSRVRKLVQSETHSPQWLHTPALNLGVLKTLANTSQPSCTTDGPQNTDPLVFGDRFRYVFCRQVNGGKPTTLSYLNKGDIILFGSALDRGSLFALDTVFVVGVHDLVRSDGRLPDWESDLHRKITMDLIQVPDFGLRLYGGETWSTEKPFSFVPCLPAEPHPNGFPRPVIKPSGPLKEVINPKSWRGPKITELDEKYARAAWDTVVEQVLDQHYALGTAVDEPDFAS